MPNCPFESSYVINILRSRSKVRFLFKDGKQTAGFVNFCTDTRLRKPVSVRNCGHPANIFRFRRNFSLYLSRYMIFVKLNYVLTVPGGCSQGSPSTCIGNRFFTLTITWLHCANLFPEDLKPVRTWPMCKQFSKPTTSINLSPISVNNWESIFQWRFVILPILQYLFLFIHKKEVKKKFFATRQPFFWKRAFDGRTSLFYNLTLNG